MSYWSKRGGKPPVHDQSHIIDLQAPREYYAEELRAVANLQSETLVRAFAKVPREDFVGPGPWQILNPWHIIETSPKASYYRETTDADPRQIYHNVLIAIDAKRRLNNGEPAFVGFLIDSLELQAGGAVIHIGCGTGYYSAIIAEVVGPTGHVTAIEIDSELAARARKNLEYLACVEVIQGDGGDFDAGPADAILVNAGATHPRAIWLDSLRPGGRITLPLTVSEGADGGGGGRVLKVTRQPEGFTASFISGVGIFSCVGSRDSELNQRLKEAFEREDWQSVQSLRRDKHDPTDTCWLHADNFCLSKLGVADTKKSLYPV
jgi:protein-L-isoaspartate(D-aspartate) O-methyltransferase